ncbi:MAG: dTDP-4-dehydrorhamnose 3,5-epimerase [Alphaproteobacteria bacterium]|nr:dTDP-4-dehydrorhamnose 3,5-epimerase [Alphaproteobacteria bacterium]
MIFHYTEIEGAFVVEPERHEDNRGWFARTYCQKHFEEMGLATEFSQCSASFNQHRGTLRGLHFQKAPFGEAKLVRCVQGAVFDVAVDIRPDSNTFGAWTGIELSAANVKSLYIPDGCAHGFQTLTHDTELFYQIDIPYQPDYSCGLRHDDPEIGIDWPIDYPTLSERDKTLPLLAELTGDHSHVQNGENRPNIAAAS